MSLAHLIATCVFLVSAGAAVAEVSPGIPHREFHGRIFYYKSVLKHSPVWYEPNGIIATKRVENRLLWPEGQFNKIYK